MNILTAIMLLFAAAGFIDKMFSLRWGLSEYFDKGLYVMGTMVIPIMGVCSVGFEFVARHQEAIVSGTAGLPFDPTMIFGVLIAPDLGGYYLVKAIAPTPEILILNGVILGTVLGQAICFQLPVFLASVGRQNRRFVLRGFLVGFTMIPLGMLAGQAVLQAPAGVFLAEFIPILVLCMLLALGLYKIPDGMIRGFGIIGKLIQLATNLMFAIAVVGLFVPRLAYADAEIVHDALIIVFKSAVIISGSLVMSQLILKLFRPQLQRFATRIGVNEVSVVCMLMNCATSLAILPMFDRMDDKGKLMNSAFSISGAYIIGGSMAFVSAVSDGFTVGVFLLAKAVSGLASMVLMHLIYEREQNPANSDR